MPQKIKYRVRPSERWADVHVFFEKYPVAMEQLRSHFGKSDFDFNLLSVRSMIEAANGIVPTEFKERFGNMTVKSFCEAYNGLMDGLDDFLLFLENTQPPQTIFYITGTETIGNLRGMVFQTVPVTPVTGNILLLLMMKKAKERREKDGNTSIIQL